jgi:hypothetical protein
MTVHVAMMYGEGSLRRMCSLSVLTDSFLLGVKVMDIFSLPKHLFRCTAILILDGKNRE